MKKYIIRGYASMLAKPSYFEVDDPSFAEKLIEDGWVWVATVEVTKHDKQIEGILKRCSPGSEAERRNLQIMFNFNNV